MVSNETIKERNVPGLRVGKTGLEKALENELIGTNGVQRFEVNAYGKRINQIDFKEGEQGKTIKLTIDTEIQKNPFKPLLNKTVSGLYSPGSTIKPIVALSALENDVITPNLKVNCRGHKHPLELYGMKYHCWKKQGHGYMSLKNAIKQSCDTYFYEAARLSLIHI